VPEQVIKDTMANAGVPLQARDDNVIKDMQDPTRGTSLPGGTIYLPGSTSQDNARVVHEIFHQVQYNDLGTTTAVQQFTEEQRKFSAGENIYDYTINNKGTITTLNDITTLEAAANYVEDFANSYITDKSNGSYSARTKEIWQMYWKDQDLLLPPGSPACHPPTPPGGSSLSLHWYTVSFSPFPCSLGLWYTTLLA
jgi:hypothetical protein